MKIKKLHIKNIASLKGEHCIDFEEISNHSKTIAITGETGAGKSSILSCISIALFGKNHKDNFSQTDLVTLGEEEAEVKLKFNVANIEYMSVWKCRVRKKNKELLKKPTITRSLYIFEDDKERELNTTADEIIGLSFDQFTKTIILNQGEFSQFLLSNFTDRKKILESLVSDYNLVDLSVKSKRNLNTIENKLEVVHSKIDGLKENTDYDKEEVVKQLKDIKIELDKSAQKKEIFKDYDNLTEEILKDIKNYSKTKDQTKQSENLIAQSYELLNSAKKELTKCIDKNNRDKDQTKEQSLKIAKAKETKAHIDASAKQITQLIEILEKEKQQINQKSKNHKKYEIEIHKIEEQLTSLKGIPQINKEELLLLQDTYKKYTSFKYEQKNITDKNELLIQNKKELDQEIEKDQMLIKDQTLIAKDIDLIKKIEVLNTEHNKLLEKKDSLLIQTKTDEENKKKYDTYNLQKDELSNKITSQANIELSQRKQVDILEQANQANNLKKQISNITIESLQMNECLICHSTDLSKINKKENLFTDYSQELEQENKKLTNTLRELDLLRSKEDELSLQITTLHSKLLNNKKNKTDYQLVIKNTQELINKIEILTKKQVKQDQSINEIKRLTEALDKKTLKLSSLKRQITQNQEKAKELESQINKTTDIAISYISNFNKDEFETILKRITSKQELTSRLKQGKEIVFNIENDINQLQTNSKSLESKISDLKEIILSNQKLIPSDLLDKNLDKLLDIIQKNLHLSEEELNLAHKTLNTIKVNSAQEKSKYTMQLEQLKAYESQFLMKITSFPDTNIEILNKIKNKLSTASNVEDISLPLLIESHSTIKDQRTLVSDKFIHLKETKSKLDLLHEQALKNERLVSESLQEIKSLKKKQGIAKELYSILGKDEFRNHVLSIVEKNLILSTNHQLNQLCQGRYILKQKINKSTASSEYYIIDKLNFSMQRKVSTLSGGETFMVSLAMAIALSELTRGENIIDNFFIDEGFGTLDEDSIEEVLEMLNSIKSQGKTITLISHIKSLTARIPVNINVQRSESGSSSIKTLFQ